MNHLVMNSALIFLSSAMLTWVLVLWLLPFLKRWFTDHPNTRSSHIIPTPSGGGIAVVTSCIILNTFFSQGNYRLIFIFCLPLALTGLIDDFNQLPAKLRYLMQVITAVLILFISPIDFSNFTYFLSIVLVTAIINFFNFMDGLDGLIASCGCLIMASLSSWSLSGALFGFLLWNWSPAKVFMGDVGSTFIGAVFAAFIFQSNNSVDAISMLLISFPIMGDSVSCLIRRLLNHENIFKAHKKHLFQRLSQAGWSHSKVSLLYMLATLLLILARYWGGVKLVSLAIAIELLFAMHLDSRVAIKFRSD